MAPINISGGTKLIVHLIPHLAFSKSELFDVPTLSKKHIQFAPMYAPGYDSRFTSAGKLYYYIGHKELCLAYTELYLSGIIESLLNIELSDNKIGEFFVEELFNMLPTYLRSLQELGVEAPLYISLSILGIQDKKLMRRTHPRINELVKTNWKKDGYPSHEDCFLPPERAILSFDDDIVEILRPLLDRIWNVFGHERCYYFEDSGRLIK